MAAAAAKLIADRTGREPCLESIAVVGVGAIGEAPPAGCWTRPPRGGLESRRARDNIAPLIERGGVP
jgi:hypothetical protein